jgi:anti-sigma B factor antagonist
MKIQTTRNGQQASITIQGDIDESGAEEIKRVFREVVGSSATEVSVDLRGVAHIGSSGIGKLLVFYKDLSIKGGRLALVNVPAPIALLLREMRLDTLFTISALH